MARSRYATNYVSQFVEPTSYNTWNIPTSLQGIELPNYIDPNEPVIEYVWQFGDRLDRLASQHFQDDKYWWIIALVNRINNPLAIPVGTIITIPLTPRNVLEKLGLV